MLDFISNHKRLTVGIILYIAVFIVSIFISPWSVTDLTWNEFVEGSANSVLTKIPVNIIFFGIYELYELMAYSVSDALCEGGDVMFFISACALFSFAKLIQRYTVNFDSDDDPIQGFVLDFLYDNIFAYAICLISYYAYMPVLNQINGVFEGDSFLMKALMVALIIFLIIIPSLPHMLQIFGYVYAIAKIMDLLNYIDKSLDWFMIFEAILIFVVAAVLILIVNVVVNFLLGMLIDMLLGYLFGLGEAIVSGIGSIIRICVSIIVFILIITLVAWILSKVMA